MIIAPAFHFLQILVVASLYRVRESFWPFLAFLPVRLSKTKRQHFNLTTPVSILLSFTAQKKLGYKCHILRQIMGSNTTVSLDTLDTTSTFTRSCPRMQIALTICSVVSTLSQELPPKIDSLAMIAENKRSPLPDHS